MALENYFLFPYHFSLDWDPHTFAVGDLHEQLMPSGSCSRVAPAPLFFLLWFVHANVGLNPAMSFGDSCGVAGVIAGLDRLLAGRGGKVEGSEQKETPGFPARS